MQGELIQSGRYAKVALPVPVDRLFTYEVPGTLRREIFVGCRVEVPFGKRVLSGIVTELADEADVPGIKPIRNLFETYLPAPLLDISRWIASYYGCTVGEAMQSALPPSLRRAKIKPKPTGIVRIVAKQDGEAMEVMRKQLSRSKKQLALFVELQSSGGEAPLPVIQSEWGYARAVIDRLISSGLAVLQPDKPVESGLDSMDGEVTSLTPAQDEALESVRECLASGNFSPILLYGVTGSGKTEIYLRAARDVLSMGGGCIVLVPEIGLLPQATARYRRMFGNDVAIIHSRLTGPERFEIWEKIERGEFRIVVGPRSAVFMPVRNLRMIIVDEEQDDSYKQDDKPRYHARAVALMRGKGENATVILGSATPSAESSRHALEGNYISLRLPERVAGAALPVVEIVDMRSLDRANGLFSPQLVNRLEENIESGGQSIIFLNKRGHARFIQCNACGWVASCCNCDISLIYHRVDNSLRCHFCGFKRKAVSKCDDCSGTRLFFSGVGTQRIELDLEGLFPGVGVLRMDADTTTGKQGHQRILEEFSTGAYPILLGTQMVTKGHHFPGVSLVGVLYAEEGLNFPDFRSAERTFQTLTQVSGRAGRGESPGHVIIQTYMPEHYVFRYLRSHNYGAFMEEELRIRRELGYPPYSRLILASAGAVNPNVLRIVMAQWAQRIRSLLAQKISEHRVAILGPTPPLIARVKNRYREQVLIKGTLSQAEKDAVVAAFHAVTAEAPGGRGVDLRWDVDPESFF